MADEHEFPGIKRRRFLAMAGAASGATALAGCGGSSTTATEEPGGQDDDASDDSDDADDSSTTDTSESSGDDAQQGGEFIDTSSQAANTWDPRMNELAWVSNTLPYLFDGLLIQKPDGSGMVPHLASELPTQEDETTFTVPLREGITFHNGDQLTAEDVAYTYNWILDPDNGSVRRQNVTFIDSVEAVDDLTVRFNLGDPFALFEQRLGEPIVPKSVASDLGPEEFGRNPVGSGPFEFTEWEQSDHVTMERFDDYFLKTPNLDTYTVRIIPEAQVQFVELATGGVHEAGVPNELLQKAQSEDNINLVTLDTFDYNGIIFNPLREPFDDVRVREAMHHAVDFGEMLEAAKGVLGDRPYGYMPKSVSEAWGFPWEEWAEKYFPPKDHDKAQQLLEEAGYGDGFGKTLELKSLSFGDFKSMSIILQRELDELGYEAEITEQTIGQWVDTLNTDSYDAIDYGWTGGQDPDGFYFPLLRNLRNDPDFEEEENFAGNTSAGFLYSAYPDDEELDRADQLIRDARTSLDRGQRKEMYTEAAEIIQSKYPHLQVFSEKTALAYSGNVKDYDPTSFTSQPLVDHWNNAYIDE